MRINKSLKLFLEPELQHPVQGEHLRRGRGGRGRGGGKQGTSRESHRGESALYLIPCVKGKVSRNLYFISIAAHEYSATFR